VNTLQRGLSPLFDIYMGEGGEGGYPHRYRGRGIGGYKGGGGYKKPLCNYRGVGCVFDISK